jgi:uncharacterized membrane protein YfcA
MGGGIIIKPVMDMLGSYDVESIGMLSTLTILSMSAVSIGRQMLAKAKIPLGTAIPLAFGSVIGGITGQSLLEIILALARKRGNVLVLQNVVLILLIIAVIFYMQSNCKKKGQVIRGILVTLLTGWFLGAIASFLSIGGGTINVALIIYLFSFDTKTATICSLIAILFSQLSKLATVAMTIDFADFNLEMAPIMVVGAIVGGLFGAELNKRLNEKTIIIIFNCVQILVLGIAILNIVRNVG